MAYRRKTRKKGTKRKAVRARTTREASVAIPDVKTVLYVHGIGNKPLASVLKRQWDEALFRVDMGDRSRMAYWVDRERYPEPIPTRRGMGDTIEIGEAGVKDAFGIRDKDMEGKVEDWLEQEIAGLNVKPSEREFLHRLGTRLLAREEDRPADRRKRGPRVKVLPLPPFLRRWVTRRLTRLVLRDVNDFLFDEDKRKRMEQAVLERLDPESGPLVVIAHSQGSMIAYEVLRKMAAGGCDVRLFLTIGSPLGLAEVQDQLRRWTNSRRLPVPKCVAKWVNVSERLDPVCFDVKLEDDFWPKGLVEDHTGLGLNPDAPRHPHSATGYLKSDPVQAVIRQVVGHAFSQVVTDFVLARDLVSELEDATVRERRPVLIQLSDITGDAPLAEAVEALREELRKIIDKSDWEDAQVDVLKRYVSAKLTREETERLRARHLTLNIHRVWRDSKKSALIDQSAQRVQAIPAQLGFGARGEGIAWAVLDTGIRSDHPHFQKNPPCVVASWDSTRPGPLQQGGNDLHGHGTHVAGIIAGCHKVGVRTFSGMAPATKLHAYKVLDDDGSGQDSWIIKAIDHVAQVNEDAGHLVIHGVNLSLGGPFDPNVYGCGHSPLCQELRRLWRQGVLVVLAAGNEGYAVLQSLDGTIDATMDLSIGDPANLQDSIVVGSVHRTKPHLYGVSFFSSRGPTADGRLKPDVVAPGEKIWSARAVFNLGGNSAEDLYIRMSGTSMAAPHVSGLLAGFLSVRTEFIGYPDRVKEILLDNCTDLRRDRYIQGHGLPNLVKMLTNT